MNVKPGNPRYKFLKSAKNNYLSENEHKKIFGMLDDKTFSLVTAISKVYTSADDKWCLKDEGILCFVKCYTRKTFLLQLFNMDSLRKSWELEMYIEINPSCTPKFIVFEGENCMVGLSFAYQSDCDSMKNIIEQKIMARGPERQKGSMPSGNKILSGNRMKLELQRIKGIPGKIRLSRSKTRGGISKGDIGLPSGFKNLADQKPDVDAEFFKNNPDYYDFFKRAFPDTTLSDIKSDPIRLKKLMDFMKSHKTQISNYQHKMRQNVDNTRQPQLSVQKIESEDDFPSEEESPCRNQISELVDKNLPRPPTQQTNINIGIPTPPPPPPISLVNQQVILQSSDYSNGITEDNPKLNCDLMTEIHSGTILKKAPPLIPKTNDRDNLLSAIRQAPKLRPTTERTLEPKIEQEDGLIMQLRAAMAMHRNQVQGDDSDEFSDDDWSD